jgi:hypothetical protein
VLKLKRSKRTKTIQRWIEFNERRAEIKLENIWLQARYDEIAESERKLIEIENGKGKCLITRPAFLKPQASQEPGSDQQALIGMLGSGASKGDGPPKRVWKPRKEVPGVDPNQHADALARKDAEIDSLKEKIKAKEAKEEQKQLEKDQLERAEYQSLLSGVAELDIEYGPLVPEHYVSWGLPQEYEHRYRFIKLFDDDEVDLRADATKLMDLKHLKTLKAEFEYTHRTPGWFTDNVKTKRFTASLEAIVQLCAPSIVAPYMDPSTAAERLRYAAQSLYTVNTNRYDALKGEFPIQNAVYVAYALYVKSAKKMKDLDFTNALAGNQTAPSSFPGLAYLSFSAAASAAMSGLKFTKETLQSASTVIVTAKSIWAHFPK